MEPAEGKPDSRTGPSEPMAEYHDGQAGGTGESGGDRAAIGSRHAVSILEGEHQHQDTNQ
jgi:hypothetical protein